MFFPYIILNDIIQNKSGLPFYPILGDATKLTHFGGALVVYMWIKGVAPKVHEKVLKTFLADRYAMYFITAEKISNLTLCDKVNCRFSMCKEFGNMTLYIYSKKDQKGKKKVTDGEIYPSPESLEVEHGFKLHGWFHNLTTEETKEKIKKLVKIKMNHFDKLYTRKSKRSN